MPRTAGGGGTHLPTPLTRLIGRRKEVGEVRELLGQSRLVTLVGLGGIGKTRLAVEVARDSPTHPVEDVRWVPLAEITDPDLLVPAVLAALGKPGRSGHGAQDLTTGLGNTDFLIILDNCEHLINACAELVETILRADGRTRILATSREPLRVDGEAVYRVPHLSLPSAQESVQPRSAIEYDAVALFVERATALNADFEVGPDNADQLVALCRMLDGLPLAIELAAAASRFLSLQELAGGDESDTHLALKGNRSAPARHRSLMAAMDYSFDLCSPEARDLWMRLAIFRGGASLDAVERIGALEPGLPDVKHVLAELVDKSIVIFDGRRYRLLEIVRSYGKDRLRASGRLRSVALAHRDIYAELAEDLDQGWFGPDQPALLQRALEEQSNIRAALGYSLAEPGESRAGLRMAGDLFAFWMGSSLPGEGRYWLDRLLSAAPHDDEVAVQALWVNGFLTSIDGDVPGGLEMLARCRELALDLGDDAGYAHATQKQGLAELLGGRTGSALEHLEEAVRLERALGENNPFLADALIEYGSALVEHETLADAIRALEECRQICAANGEQLFQSWALGLLGLTDLLAGRPRDAKVRLHDALLTKRTLSDAIGISWCVEILAWVAFEEGEIERAAQLLGASQALAATLGRHLSGYDKIVRWHEEYQGRIRSSLGEHIFKTAFEAGRRLSDDDAVALALGVGETEAAVDDDPLARLPLTPRERQIAQMVATGQTNREIANELVIALRTVDTHVEHILTKLEFHSRTQVAALFASARV